MPAAARCALWWFASLRLLLGLAGLPALPISLPRPTTLPLVSQTMHRAEDLVSHAQTNRGGLWIAPASRTVTGSPSPAAASNATRVAHRLDPRRALAFGWIAVWLAGVVATLIVHVRDARRLARVWRNAVPVRSIQVHDWLAQWIGTDRALRVRVRASTEVGAPLIIGGSRARIIVPSGRLDHDAEELRMALAHEVSHVRRGDLGWGLVPALAQCVFWFHPFAHWCVREYAQTREEACDAEALRLSAVAPHRYGELLVGFGVDSSRPIYAAASCGSTHVHQLTRRLHMLAFASRSSRAQRTIALGATLAIGLLSIVPVRLVAASAVDGSAAPRVTNEQDDRRDQSKDTRTTRTARSTRSTRSTRSSTSSPSSRSTGYGHSYSTGDRDEDAFSYGFSHGDGQTMSGSWDSRDQQWLEKLERRAQGAYAWFRVGHKTYLVVGDEDVDRIKEIMRPEVELGEQQGRLGEQQGRLGDRQGALGDKQSDLGDRMSQLSSKMVDIESRLADERDGEDRSSLERQRGEIQDQMSELSTRMSELGRQQSALGREQSALGEKQSALGRRQQAASREAREKMRELGRQMIDDGRGVLVDD
jgi:beta-lactamase regulating signal transducer with metallopeptidase domain